MRRKVLSVILAAGVLSVTALLSLRRGPEAWRVADILAVYEADGDFAALGIDYPLDGTVFPPEMVPPEFRWTDGTPSRAWLVQVARRDGEPLLNAVTRQARWRPEPQAWQDLKQQSRAQAVRVLVLGVDARDGVRVLSRGQMAFRTSEDPVAAPLFYREVILPFLAADKDPAGIRWRFGSIASPEPPPVVLQDLPVCGNCHSFSRDGSMLAMDVDFASNKGAYVVTEVKQRMTLTKPDMITWSSYGDGEQSYGLLSQISPDGRYVVSTVKDLSIFMAQPDRAFSQLFFPVKGILCVFDRQTGRFRALPGADDPAFVQSNPTWSPDGASIVFARADAPDLQNTKHQGHVWLTPPESRAFVADGKPFRFDLYKVPFNGGAGGTAEPLAGAAHNGMSNYFARYSPDGRWIVFCRARSYMLLQPDSELYIIPAAGGTARRLRCNTGRMNSWHSFAPNGKWLVFASKAYSDYTQLFLTHIDPDGNSSPPVVLDHLTAPDRAANIPEFVNAEPNAIATIREQFLHDR